MGEDREERLDRELIELLNELRVALPGVQVLFAFLLTVPFTDAFGRLTEVQRDTYFGAFLATSLSSVFLISPTAYHRLRWRQYDKERMLVFANRVSILGVVFLALAIGLVVFVITDLLFGRWFAAVITGGVSALIVWLWFGVPLWRRVRDGDQ